MSEKYRLFGFYNFLDIIPDFVYPIFERSNKLYYEMGEHKIDSFIELSDYECSKVKKIETQNVDFLNEYDPDKVYRISSDLMFAYQNFDNKITFGDGTEIARFLKNINTNNKYETEVINDFLEEISDIITNVTEDEQKTIIVYYYGTGRRKTSVARVFLNKGFGNIRVNNLAINQYFSSLGMVGYALKPLQILGLNDKIDAKITVRGGGFSGQSGAISLGIARALLKMNSEYKKKLKESGLLTRDSRMKERKKYGLKSARKAPQFSKR